LGSHTYGMLEVLMVIPVVWFQSRMYKW
jgi:hypothetical protein